MCMVQYAYLFGLLREKALGANDITYAGHYEKSLSSDNDLPCHLRKMKIISPKLDCVINYTWCALSYPTLDKLVK